MVMPPLGLTGEAAKGAKVKEYSPEPGPAALVNSSSRPAARPRQEAMSHPREAGRPPRPPSRRAAPLAPAPGAESESGGTPVLAQVGSGRAQIRGALWEGPAPRAPWAAALPRSQEACGVHARLREPGPTSSAPNPSNSRLLSRGSTKKNVGGTPGRTRGGA